MEWTLIENKIVKTEDARISASCLGFTLAASVFEAIRVNWNRDREEYYIPNFKLHLKRFFTSLKIMRMDIDKNKEEIENMVTELIRYWNEKTDGYIRITGYISSGSKTGSVYNPEDVRTDVIISIKNSPWSDSYTSDVRCCVSSWRRIDDNTIPPRVKSAANYENTRLAGQDAVLNGFDNAILLNSRGKVSEAAESTLFIVDDNNNLITPTLQDDILESLNRLTICKIWKDLTGRNVIERSIDRTELYVAKEAFLCNTAKMIRNIVSIDNYTLSNSSTTVRNIANKFNIVVRGNNILLNDTSLVIDMKEGKKI
ncbi:aminotransferase class IV [Enterococcus cecorum]|uniref:aminotransferase class IV n=1 Tax=Enterococcus cecorum TaxID=44008 RepID=UPI00148E34C5